jgi:DNA-binding XRE family transcriptional regulator
MSQSNLGDKINISGSHIGKIERGESRCDRTLAVRMDELFSTAGLLASLWDELVQSAAFPPWFDWPEVEAEAVQLQVYQCLILYGLLQTEAYAAALLDGDAEAVAARMTRQKILTRAEPPPPRISVVLTEYVLTNEVGGREVMRDQLKHLLELSSSRLTIQILTGPLPPSGNSGAFVLATMPDRSEIAYVDSGARGFTLNEQGDMHTLAGGYDEIRSRALPVDLSNDHIQRIMEERWC